MKVAWALEPKRWTKVHVLVAKNRTHCGIRLPRTVFNIEYADRVSDLDNCKICEKVMKKENWRENAFFYR